MREGPGVAAMEAQLAHVLEPVDFERRRSEADRPARHLHEDVAGLEAVASNFDDFREPFRMSDRVPDELPNPLDRSVDECLMTVSRHGRAILSDRKGRAYVAEEG